MFNKLAPNFSSLRNLESLTITDHIHDLTDLQDLDSLTQLTIRFGGLLCCSNPPPPRWSAHATCCSWRFPGTAIQPMSGWMLTRYVAM